MVWRCNDLNPFSPSYKKPCILSFFKTNGHCSNKLKKEISFLSRQGQVAHISKGVSSPPRTNIIKAQKYQRRGRKAEMDVISSAALNQYLITDAEERLEWVSVCVCERARKSETGYQVGTEVVGDGIKCYICASTCAGFFGILKCICCVVVWWLSLCFCTRFFT